MCIGVAFDEAFNFYYADLFDVLPSLGAKVVQFSPIHDRLPDADGYIIGGGYPELFVPELEANDRMRDAIRDISKNGAPIYAECGGLMYLTDRMVLKKGWQGRENRILRRDVRGIPGPDPYACPVRGQLCGRRQ